MQVAKITTYDGRVFHTNDLSEERLQAFFTNLKAPSEARNHVEVIEMTPEEYMAIPPTMVAMVRVFPLVRTHRAAGVQSPRMMCRASCSEESGCQDVPELSRVIG